MSNPGCLYLCATPIGNLEDITLRALKVLQDVDLVAAEDTRRTRKLLSHYDIHTSLTSYHQHNFAGKGQYLLDKLLEGKNIALVSDAGLPGISDPGEDLVALVLGHGVKVVPIPGPSASLAALVVSGLSTKRFCFEGFLPSKGSTRRKHLEKLKLENRTMIFYEAPHRLLATLTDLAFIWGDRQICIARELTKQFEEVWHGNASQGIERFSQAPPKGEITIIAQGAPRQEEGAVYSSSDLIDMVINFQKRGLSNKDAIKETALLAGVPKREIYALVIEKKEESN